MIRRNIIRPGTGFQLWAVRAVSQRIALITVILLAVEPAAVCRTSENSINPVGIVIHNSALSAEDVAQFPGPTDVSVIDALHQRRGFSIICGGRSYHIGYHYVILPDGKIQTGRPDHCIGAHTLGRNNALGICLIGNFSTIANPEGRLGNEQPTREQIRSLVMLTVKLRRKYRIPCEQVQRHHDIKPETLCPGDRFPWADIRAQIGCGI